MIPMVPLNKISRPISRPVAVAPGTSYRTIGVKWWGKGAYERETIDGSQTAARELFLVRDGDLIINKIWVRHGSVAIASKIVDGCAASAEFPMFELDLAQVLPRWLHWYTQTQRFWDACDQLSHGTSGKNRIRPELFVTIEVPLPPLPEQRRIVARIEELAGRIAEARGLREKAREETGGTLTSAIEATFRQTAARGVSSAALSDPWLCRLIPGQHILSRDYNTEGDGDPYITGPADFGEKYPVMTKWTSNPKSFALPGDVLVTVKGAGVGKLNCAPDQRICIGRQVMALRPAEDRLVRDYLYYFLMGKRGYFRDAARSTTVPGLKREHIWALGIPLPDLTEQSRIAAYLDSLQNQVRELIILQHTTQAELDSLLRAVVERAFRGELC